MSSHASSNNSNSGNNDGIILQGYHRKLKTMKKKFFVLYSDMETKPARLEYFDSEKKFKSRSNPKRIIILKNCFNINRRLDTKYNNVIALSTKDEVFCIVLETEAELNEWLRALLALQRGEETESNEPKPFFEHVWQVQMQRKGSAEEKGIIGKYYVCLTTKSVTLVRIGSQKTPMSENRLPSVEFNLTTIRRCGDSQCFFYMEVGRHSAIGAGELWMQTEDPLIAQNMHAMIISAMSSCKNTEELFAPISRKRALSATEASKPITALNRRQTHAGNKPTNSPPLSGFTMARDRCDSLPSRSECNNTQLITRSTMPPPTRPVFSNRPLSICVSSSKQSQSPPSHALSPSTGCSESGGSSLSLDETDSVIVSTIPDESGNFGGRFYNSHASDDTIPEENFADKIPRILDNMNNAQLTLPITYNPSVQNMRKPNPAAAHVEFIDMPGQYIDMLSPQSPQPSSPCDHTGFMPISPSNDYPCGIHTGSSGGHSRASSLTEESDGYVPMCPHTTLGYVDMEQFTKHHLYEKKKSGMTTSSVTSGTPSTDVRFAEYSLDKVKSRFTPEDDDLQQSDGRPARAYSVGSRPEHVKRKFRVELVNSADQNNSRVRAFSVGSRAKVPRSDLYRNGYTANQTCQMNKNNHLFMAACKGDNSKGTKSSSVPLLVNKSANSVDRMSDLMEIDFTKNSNFHSNTARTELDNNLKTQELPQTSQFSMFSPSFPQVQRESESFKNSTDDMTCGYLLMKSTNHTEHSCVSFGQKLNERSGYLEMKPVSFIKATNLSTSPVMTASDNNTARSSLTLEANYMNVSSSAPSTFQRQIKSNRYICPQGKFVETETRVEELTRPAGGYMEMSFNKNQCAPIENFLVKNNADKSDESRYVTPPIDIAPREKINTSSFDTLDKAAYQYVSSNPEIIFPSYPTIFPFNPKRSSKSFALSQPRQQKDVDIGIGNMHCDSLQHVTKSVEAIAIPEFTLAAIDKKLNFNSEETTMPISFPNVEALSSEYADMSITSDKATFDPETEILLEPDITHVKCCQEESVPKILKNRIKIHNAILNPTAKKYSNSSPNNSQTLASDADKFGNSLQKFTDFAPCFKTNEKPFFKNLCMERSQCTNPRISQDFHRKNESSSGYEVLQINNESCLQPKTVFSSPDSINNGKGCLSKSIYGHTSVNTENMKSATSSSISTLCGSISSPTISRSKSQSPSSSRPQSLTESYTLDTTLSRSEYITPTMEHVLSSRPTSVSSERELIYVSLDLPPVSSSITMPTANVENNTSHSITKGNILTTCEPSPSPSESLQEPTFSYAQIDFNKSHECCK